MNSKENSRRISAKCKRDTISLQNRKDRITKTDLERQLKEATSNEHCHANVSLLNEISYKTSN